MSDRRVNYLSLGCPKALVDSEHIVTALVDGGYEVVSADEPGDLLIINTCGFIDAAKDESFEAIESALADGREVIVTGCLGADEAALTQRFPKLKHVSGPADVQPVLNAVQSYVPSVQQQSRSVERLPGEARARGAGTRLTPEHYAYLKISEGCNHKCSFCIIPTMRGPLRSRDIDDVLREACGLAEHGAKELMVIAQDLSAYGADIRYRESDYEGRQLSARLTTLCDELADIVPWVRLHYVYPYPHVDALIPLMSEGRLLPYLDMPLQHASPRMLNAMRRPAAAEKTLERVRQWRQICPELSIRSTFIVGFPGETEEDVSALLDFLEEAQLDRVGCFAYSAVAGAHANELADPVSERTKLDRQERVYELQAQISAARLNRHVGTRLRVIVDERDGGTAIARSMFDAPEIDGVVQVREATSLNPGDFAWVQVESRDDHDLYATYLGSGVVVA